jgi:pantoate--beta-alanine ligase
MKSISIISRSSDLKQKLIDLGIGHRAIVPTMGNLHQGHLELVRQALIENDIVIVSIFVNPTQFAPNEDYNQYPRTLDNDLKLLRTLFKQYEEIEDKQLLIFTPEASEIYNDQFATQVSVPSLNHILEGEIRPTHFDGVATVVFILFSLSKPHRAYFGQKDWQQYLVIRQMVIDLKLGIDIIAHPIVRDHDGLALSSRNQYLSQEERKNALILPKTLHALAAEITTSEKLVPIKKMINEIINNDAKWNYLAIRDAYSLGDISTETQMIVIIAAYQLGSTRLLDNILVELK